MGQSRQGGGAEREEEQARYKAMGVMDGYAPDGVSSVTWEAQYEKDKEGGWIWGNHREAGGQSMGSMQRMVRERKHCFAYSMQELPGYHKPVNIGRYSGKPAYSRRKQYSQPESELIGSKSAELRDAGMVRKAGQHSAFASRPTCAAKRDALTGAWTDVRFCINYVLLNKGTETDPYPLPLPEAIFRRFGRARFFTKLDMRSGFHQLVLDEESQRMSAFWWGNELWCYTRLPFGMKNSSAVFQRVMDEVLQEAGLEEVASAFIDDVIVWGEDAEQHVEDVRRVLEALHQVGLRVHPDKSIFMAEGVEYLGHVVSPTGLHPAEARVAAFKQLKRPSSKEELKSQLGMLGFYRCYLPNYSIIAEPLRRFLKKAAPSLLEWDEEAHKAYEGLVEGLTEEGLCLQRVQEGRRFVLHTDWSTRGLGAVLHQVDERGNEGMVACISRSLNEHEARYTAWKGELLAVVWAVKHFRPYLAGRDFTIVTDHRPLLWLMSTPELSGQQERWVLALQEFSYVVEHRPGVVNPADVPSRYPQGSSADPTGARLDDEGSLHRVLPRVCFETEELRQQAIKEFVEGTCVAEPGLAAVLVSQSPRLECTVRVEEAAAQWHMRQQFCDALPPVAKEVVECVVSSADLQEGEGAEFGFVGSPEQEVHPRVLFAQGKLREWARRWVENEVVGSAEGSSVARVAGIVEDEPGALCVDPIGESFWGALDEGGVVVVELFGGMCAGLEACLRNGWKVRRYVYVDKDAQVREVAQFRVATLMAKYPTQLGAEACREAFTFWPQDVCEVKQEHVEAMVQLGGAVVVWAGFECQDLSPAGAGRGLGGSRSGTFFPLRDLLVALQLGLGGQLGYVVENSAFMVPWQKAERAEEDYRTLVGVLGEPLELDAAQFGSRAHRLRYYWTNLAGREAMLGALKGVRRAEGLLVQDILDPGRVPRKVNVSDQPPFYPCNVVGQSRRALPTLMATVGSYAFKGSGQGCVFDARLGKWVEPNPDEREAALGYQVGATAAPGVSELIRHQVTGRCMDGNTVMVLVAVAQALGRKGLGSVSSEPCVWGGVGACVDVGGVARTCAVGLEDGGEFQVHKGYLGRQVVAAVAAQQEPVSSRDIWEDAAALELLQGGRQCEGISRQERSRLAHRAKLYSWQQGQLWRRMPDGSMRVVPKPEDRAVVVQRIHEQTGHFGVKRTADMVASGHWWRSLHKDVAAQLSQCGVCDRVRASFNSLQPQLSPLPVEPMFYRWGFDLCGEFPQTSKGFKWVLVAVEHFSKHIELLPLHAKTPQETAARAAEVFCRFGAPAEVVTDGGGEWEGEFEQLLSSCFIDHRVTSPNHPQANGLAERVVQVVKRGLRKLCESAGDAQWDGKLPWLALGYRCSRQASTGFSPYQLLYAREPVFPSSVREVMVEPLDLDSGEAAAQSLLERAELLRQRIPVAAENLKAAQHRDTLRYQQLRSGSYLPKVADFRPGDFVYLKRVKAGSTLAIRARPLILKVLEARQDGSVVLQDKAGSRTVQQVSQLAPCHLPGIDGSVDPTLKGEDLGALCRVCGSPDDEAVFMFCDHCNSGWHTYCCDPPLAAVPSGCFICDICRGQGVTVEQVEEAQQQRDRLRQLEGRPELFPLADMRRRDERAAALHGRLLCKKVGGQVLWGRLNYKGPRARPRYFVVEYAGGEVEDGLTYRLVDKGKAYSLQPESAVPPAGVVVPVAHEVPR